MAGDIERAVHHPPALSSSDIPAQQLWRAYSGGEPTQEHSSRLHDIINHELIKIEPTSTRKIEEHAAKIAQWERPEHAYGHDEETNQRYHDRINFVAEILFFPRAHCCKGGRGPLS